jgi:hypothetical protein
MKKIFLAVFFSFASLPLAAQTPTLAWGITQLVPSPTWASETGNTAFGLTWQVTPALWSYNAQQNSFHTFIASPIARYSGSVEAYVSPEYLSLKTISAKWELQTGLRTYFPIVQYGENLAASAGVSYTKLGNQTGLGYEAGIYVLAGIFGFQIEHAPNLPNTWTYRLRIRYF